MNDEQILSDARRALAEIAAGRRTSWTERALTALADRFEDVVKHHPNRPDHPARQRAAGEVMIDPDAELIRTVRKKLGLTQQAFADKLGVSFATVNRWEAGKTKPQRALMNLIRAMGSTPQANGIWPLGSD